MWAARRTSAHTRDHTLSEKTHSGHGRIIYSPPNSEQPLLSLSSVEKPPNSNLKRGWGGGVFGGFVCSFGSLHAPLGDGKFLQPLDS